MALTGGGGVRILSVDLGSSSVRAELYDDSGTRQEDTETKLDYELEYTPDGGVAVDADELLDLVVRAIDGALDNAGNTPISGVATSTFWHSVLGLDGDGRPTTPVLYWADRRGGGPGRGGGGARRAAAWTSRRSTAVLAASSTPATGPRSSCG
jgi:gluconokinase